jgi:hypothetical protein
MPKSTQDKHVSRITVVRCNHRRNEKASSITYSECVFTLALVIRHANRIFSASHYTVICGRSGPTKFLHISHKRHDFRKKGTEHKIRVLHYFL